MFYIETLDHYGFLEDPYLRSCPRDEILGICVFA